MNRIVPFILSLIILTLLSGFSQRVSATTPFTRTLPEQTGEKGVESDCSLPNVSSPQLNIPPFPATLPSAAGEMNEHESPLPVDTTNIGRDVTITTNDGNTIRGTLLRRDDDEVAVRTSSVGEVTIRRSDIRQLLFVDEGEAEQEEGPFTQTTRELFTQNGYGLKKGQTYYQNMLVLFNSITTGLTDNISLTGGILPLFLFSGTETPVWIGPKVAIPIIDDVWNVGVGGYIGAVIGSPGFYGTGYFVSTFGSRETHFSVGAGQFFSDEGFVGTSPYVSLSGSLNISPRWTVMMENYILIQDGVYGTSLIGGRYMIDRASFDFGLIIPVGVGELDFAIPTVGVTLPF